MCAVCRQPNDKIICWLSIRYVFIHFLFGCILNHYLVEFVKQWQLKVLYLSCYKNPICLHYCLGIVLISSSSSCRVCWDREERWRQNDICTFCCSTHNGIYVPLSYVLQHLLYVSQDFSCDYCCHLDSFITAALPCLFFSDGFLK